MSTSRSSTMPLIARRYAMTAALCLMLGGVCVAIGYEAGWGATWRLSVIPPAETAAQSADVTLLPVFAMAPLDPTFTEIIDRPLFVPSRRPSPAGSAVPVVAMRRGQFRLTGTAVNSTLSMAFLVEKTSGRSFRAITGAEVGMGSGIKVDSVGPTRVVLRQGDETEELILTTAPSSQVAAAAPVNVGASALPGSTATPVPSGQPAATSTPLFNTNAGTAAPTQAFTAPSSPTAVITVSPPVTPDPSVTRRRRFQNLTPAQ